MPVHAFDVYGTLLDVQSAAMRHADALGPRAARLAELWRAKQLEYTWVLNSLGRHEPFEVLTEQALDHSIELVGGVPSALRDQLLDAYGSLDAHGDARTGLALWKAARDTLVAFSNANPSMLRGALAISRLDDLIDHVGPSRVQACSSPTRGAMRSLTAGGRMG